MHFHRIIVPIDGSENSFRAATYAIKIAKEYGAQIILIHVSSVSQTLQLFGVYGTVHSESVAARIEAAETEALPWFERIRAEAEGQSQSIEKTEVIEGPLSTVGEIVQYAEQHNADLIVIGSRGRSGFKKLVLGSVASGVVAYAPCPVLVVK